MYQLYIANRNYSSWSLRPWVLMREAGIGFAEHLVPFTEGPSGASHARFVAFSPTAKVPCLHDGDTVVWDSLAIAEYLAERHPGLWPEDAAARAFARCASAEMHSGFSALRERCTMNCGLRIRLAGIPAALQCDLDRLAELWNEGLARFGGPFLAGKRFGIVDAFFAPVAFRLQTYGVTLGEAADAYARRLLELPAMREWEAEALREPWRDGAHEDDARRAGEIVADLRRELL